MIRLALFLLALAFPAQAEQVVADMSQNRVAITANFDGSEILIFGAVKRDSPAPDAGPLQVIITVAGPAEPITVRRKDKRAGIWINVESFEIEHAPSFYAIATTAPLADILSNAQDQLYRVSIPQAIHSAAPGTTSEKEVTFTQSLIRIRKAADLYQVNPNTVIMHDETLFKTSVSLPSNLTEGHFTTRIFLTRDGNVVDVFETDINVQKVGLERWLYNLAHEKPLAYGLLSLFIAIAAGWGASAIFRFIRTS